MKKPIFRTLLCLLLVCSLLWACTPAQQTSTTTQPTTEAPKPSYAGTMEGYKYFHTNQRDRAWEEDVLFMAEEFLNGHPLLADKKFYTYSYTFEGTKMNTETAYDNSLFNAQLRAEFIAGVNALIQNIPSLSDAQIVFEAQKLIANLKDCHSFLLAFQACTERLPLFVESMTTPDGYDYLVADVPVEQEELLHTKLVSINGVSVDEIVDKLAAYGSGEWYGQTVYYAVDAFSWPLRKEALQVIGIVGETDTEVELVVTNGSEEITRTLSFVSNEAYKELDWMDKGLSDQDIPRYRYCDDRYYWYEVLNGDTMYIRFYAMVEDPNQSRNNFYTEITKVMRAAETPMHVIVDFRDNGGGNFYDMDDLANIIHQYSSGQVHILINEASTSAAVFASYGLSQIVDGAVLAGTPAGQYPRSFGITGLPEMPNSAYAFRVSGMFYIMAPENDGDPLMPDLMLYQDWEDYRSGVDTVLEYVLAQ